VIVLNAADTLAGAAPSGATEVTCTIFGMELVGTTETYKVLDQRQLAAAAATIYTVPASTQAFIRSITVVNTDTTNISTFQLFRGGTAAANAITPVFTIPAGGMALYVDGDGWQVFTASGLLLGGTNLPTVSNYSSAAQGPAFAADTYIDGSRILLPQGAVRAGSVYHLIFDITKTAAGIATPILTVRFGTAGAVGDTARLTFTWTAGTAAADVGTFEVWVTFRAIGASGVMVGVAQIRHNLSVTGLVNLVSPTLAVVSGAFDTGVAGSYIGASVNGGASAAWTIQRVSAELESLSG